MRIQYAVVCHQFQDGEWDGVTNLIGVRHKLFATVQGTAEGAAARVPLTLVVSLIEGKPGWHQVWAAVRSPSTRPPQTLPRLDIEWDEASPTFFAIYEVLLDAVENGVYEFTILVDGEPLGSVPLPVEVISVPA